MGPVKTPLFSKIRPGLLWAQGLIHGASLSIVTPCIQKTPAQAPSFRKQRKCAGCAWHWGPEAGRIRQTVPISSHGHMEYKWVKLLRVCTEVAWGPQSGSGSGSLGGISVTSQGKTWGRRRVARNPPSTELMKELRDRSARGQETGQDKNSPGRRTGRVAGGLTGQCYLCRTALESAEQWVKQEGREGSKRLLISQKQRNKGMMMQGGAGCGMGCGGWRPGTHVRQKMGQGKGPTEADQFMLSSWAPSPSAGQAQSQT